MGMTIEDCIEYIKTEYRYAINEDDMSDEKDIEVLRTILETMRKYQKIQEIVKQKDYDRFNSHNYYGYFLRVQDIKKVVEHGNDD